ncbi:MAG: LLM class F420-dependent oxidoreductase [Actinomycetes bacterium]
MTERPQTRWGLTLPLPMMRISQLEPLVRAADEAGYDDLWTGETNGPDAFTPLALAATWTERMRLGTGVAGVFTRGPALLAQQSAALQDASGGRFVLGIGSSSNVIVEKWNGMGPFEKPLTKVRETVEAVRPILEGGRGPGGFKLENAPETPPPIYIAALRDKMLRLGGEIADGTFVNFLPLSGLPHVTEQIREGERAAGKAEGGSDVVCRFFCIPGDDDAAMGVAKFVLAGYATVPVYEAFFRSLGWGEALDPMLEAWREGDRGKALEVAPVDLIREICIMGSPEQMRERLAEFADGGITTLVLTPLAPPEQIPGLLAEMLPR